MVFRTQLENGVTVTYGPDSRGKVRLDYPSGESIETTWGHISQVQSLVSQLTDAYHNLLSLTHCQRHCPYLSVDLLSRLDQAINRALDSPPPGSDQ